MIKQVTLATLIITCRLLQGASYSHEALERSAKRQCTGSSIEMPVTGMITLIGNDKKEVKIPLATALKYSGLIKTLEEFSGEQSDLQMGSLTSNPTNLTSAGISSETLKTLATLMEDTERMENDPELISSPIKLRLEKLGSLVPSDADSLKQLLKATDFLRISPMITNMIAYKTVMLFVQDISQFEDLPMSAKQALIKQLYFLGNPKLLAQITISIQDLVDHNRIPHRAGILPLHGYGIDDLEGISHIPNIKAIWRLRFDQNFVTSIAPNTFAGLSHIQSLSLANNQIEHVEPGTFKGLTNLRWLSLKDNKLKSIAKGAFAGLENLEEVIFAGNLNYPIVIEDGAFADLKALKRLIFGACKIPKITAGAFAGLDNLRELRLQGCRIKEIEPGAFEGLTHLEVVELSANPITENAQERARIEQEIKKVSPNARYI